MLAQGLSLASTLGIQVLQVPIFLAAVGSNRFGSYLIVIALPSVLIFADLGLLSASSTRMLSFVAEGKDVEAGEVSRLTNSIVYLLLPVLLLLVLLAVSLNDWEEPGLSSWEGRGIFLLYSLYALQNLYSSWLEGLLRSAGFYARGWTYISAIRLVEFAAAMVTLVLTKDLIFTVITLIAARSLGVVMLIRLARRVAPWAQWKFAMPRWAVAAPLVRPVIGSFAQPLGNALVWQGVVVVIGAALGPSTVVTFTTIRTMVNSLRQVAMVFINAGAPGLTQALARNERETAALTQRRVGLNVAALVLLGMAAIFALGPIIIDIWTSGEVVASRGLISLFLLQTAIEIFWLWASMRLIAKNEHMAFSIVYAVSSLGFVISLSLIRPLELEYVPLLQALSSLIVVAAVGICLRIEGSEYLRRKT